MSIMFLAMVVVGGLGSIMGSIAGACLLSWMDLQLRNILSIPYIGEWLEALSRSYFSITGVSNIQFIIFGLIMILIMLKDILKKHIELPAMQRARHPHTITIVISIY